MDRRQLLVALAALPAVPAAREIDYPAVTPRPLVFPRDHGAHPEFRIEWWYLTGWLDAASGPLGFQVTFFRTRTDVDPANPSAFTARQLVLVHAALADPRHGALRHDQRVARVGFGASAAETDTNVQLGRWRFLRGPDGAYQCRLPARSFTLDFTAQPTKPLLLQGEAGVSRKGPLAAQASYYYSQPQLFIRARITRDGKQQSLTGLGWLDHEWSSTLLAPEAAGWDWAGINLDDGGALTAFQIRRKDTGAALHTYASLRAPGGEVRVFDADQVRFERLAEWTSPRTRATWPIAQAITVGTRRFATKPLMSDQELDSRGSAGAVYWEGASELTENDQRVGRGYLEMTGYVAPMRL